ncbi:MAG: ATP-binding protein [Gelidibacter sp.]
MRTHIVLFWLFVPLILFSQEQSYDTLISTYQDCKSAECKVEKSFILSEYFLETDEIDKAQKWLDTTKQYYIVKPLDPMNVYIHSLQSELFYYIGIFQFGKYESRKAIELSLKLKDSALIADAYFFKGINEFEMNTMDDSYHSLSKSKTFYPKIKPKKILRTIIQNEHIHNNLAQLFLKTNQMDSAIVYNSKAYKFSLKEHSRRGIPNSEQTFGLIYLTQNKSDSAIYYLQKSSKSALHSNYYDIMLVDQGFLVEAYKHHMDSVAKYFDQGLKIMEEHPVNRSFRRIFYATVLPIFENFDDSKNISFVQDKIIKLDKNVRLKGNLYIQNITEQYIANENKLLTLEINKLKTQKKYSILQIIILSLFVLVMMLLVILYRKKNKLQQTLLHQKNDISKDLHDDIGSGLSSILIHADLLSKYENANDHQKLLLSKITSTGKDISQRMNAFIWSLNTENNNLRNFCEYAKQYSTNLFEGTPFRFSFVQNIPEADHISIDGQHRKQLFFCIKELLNNALKHSDASKIQLLILLKEKSQLQVCISDNGKGIVKENTFGNGLKNVEKRISDMDGTLDLIPENGLTVKFTIPL